MPSFGELDTLNYQVMTKTVGEFQHPNLVLTARFPDEIIDGIQARWDVLKPSRQKAGFRVPNQAASKLDLMSVDTKSATCLLMNLEKALDEGALVRILTEPKNALTKQYQALLKTEGITLKFTPDALEAIAEIAVVVNNRAQNIGARRLQTVMEKLLEDLSFDASGLKKKTFTIDAEYVRSKLAPIIKDEDLSRYIL